MEKSKGKVKLKESWERRGSKESSATKVWTEWEEDVNKFESFTRNQRYAVCNNQTEQIFLQPPNTAKSSGPS